MGLKVINRQSTYCILDLDVCLESDSKEFLETLDRDYGWFKTQSTNGKKGLNISARLNDQKDPFVRIINTINLKSRPPRLSGQARDGRQASIINHQSLRGHPSPVSCALQLVLRAIFAEIEDFIVLHAGVVAKEDKAVILAGPRGIGKTTLVLKLLECGFQFLSDDFCPVHKHTRHVHPFPRSVWVADNRGVNGKKTERKEKSRIKPDRLPSVVSRNPRVPKCLVLLDSVDTDAFCELELGVDWVGQERLGADLKGIGNHHFLIIHRQSSGATGSSKWRIRYPKGRGVTPKIRKVLATHEQHIWNVYRVDRIHPDFERAPLLSAIPTHEAAFSLLSCLKHEPIDFRDGDAHRRTPGKFFTELNGLLEGVPCYQLSVGRLDGMVGLIKGLMD